MEKGRSWREEGEEVGGQRRVGTQRVGRKEMKRKTGNERGKARQEWRK